MLEHRDFLWAGISALIILWSIFDGFRESRRWKRLFQKAEDQIQSLIESNRHLQFIHRSQDAMEAQTVIERDRQSQGSFLEIKHSPNQPLPTPEGDPTLPEAHPINRALVVGGKRIHIVGVDDETESRFFDSVEKSIALDGEGNAKVVKAS